MRAALQRGERFGRLGGVARLMQDALADDEGLIGAEAIGLGTQRARRQRLGAGERGGEARNRAAGGEIVAFGGALVDVRRDALK